MRAPKPPLKKYLFKKRVVVERDELCAGKMHKELAVDRIRIRCFKATKEPVGRLNQFDQLVDRLKIPRLQSCLEGSLYA